MHHLMILLAPAVPLACLGLLLWLDHLEETLDQRAPKAHLGPAVSPGQPERPPTAPVTAPPALSGLTPAVVDGAPAD